jgi:hypothetical protein
MGGDFSFFGVFTKNIIRLSIEIIVGHKTNNSKGVMVIILCLENKKGSRSSEAFD